MLKAKKNMSGLEKVILATLGVFALGSGFGFEANMQPFNLDRIETSFRSYLEDGKRQYGGGIGTCALAVLFYPGARVAAEIHNYAIPKDFESN